MTPTRRMTRTSSSAPASGHGARARPFMLDTSSALQIMGSEMRVIETKTRIAVQQARYMCHFTVAVSVRGSPGMLYRSALPCAAMK